MHGPRLNSNCSIGYLITDKTYIHANASNTQRCIHFLFFFFFLSNCHPVSISLVCPLGQQVQGTSRQNEATLVLAQSVIDWNRQLLAALLGDLQLD